MQEIQERKEIYLTVEGLPARWRKGKLETIEHGEYLPGWDTVDDVNFKMCRLAIIDPLTSEFVCPPKPERPYDHTTGQMIDAIRQGEKWECDRADDVDPVVYRDFEGAIAWAFSRLRLTLDHNSLGWMWRKVEV